MFRGKRLLKLAVIIVMGCAICYVYIKWDTWFYNVPEGRYRVSHCQDRIVMTPEQDATAARRISWRCGSEVTSAFVLLKKGEKEYSRIPAVGKIVTSQGGRAAYYEALLRDIKDGCKYAYRLVNGNIFSKWHYFNTALPRKGNSFIYIGDIQQEDTDKCYYCFKNLLRIHPDVDFFAFCGDMMQRPTDRYWRCWCEALDSVSPSVPIITVPGNHEYMKGFPQKLEERWKASFVYPSNGPMGAIGSSYFVDYPQLRMIMLDTQGINDPLSLFRHFVWLEKTLKDAGSKWKIVMMHHPIYSIKKGRNNYMLRLPFRYLFEKYGVQLVLQGHDHAYARMSTSGSYGIRKAPVYIISVCSPKHYKVKVPSDFDRVGANINLWQYITLRGDTLRYKSYVIRTNKLYDDITILKNGVLNENRLEEKLTMN